MGHLQLCHSAGLVAAVGLTTASDNGGKVTVWNIVASSFSEASPGVTQLATLKITRAATVTIMYLDNPGNSFTT